MEFEKYHALGNDYLVLPHDQIEGNLSEEEIRLICHRNFGLGSDRFFSVPFPLRRHSLGSAFSIPMEARQKKVVTAFASFLCTFGNTGQVKEEPFTIETLGGLVRSQIIEGANKISVEIGRVSFLSNQIPVVGETREVIGEYRSCWRNFTYNSAT